MIIARYTQQPGEIRSRSISFGGYLNAMGESARAVDPVETLTTPGLSIEAGVWIDAGNFFKVLVKGTPGIHKLTVWLYTSGGQRLEADVMFTIRDT